MKVYKGFNKDLTCRGFQFEVGKEYEEESASLCNSGFHACENPIDVLKYYTPASSVYHEVELDGVSDEREKDSKVCARKIKVGAELKLADMIKLGVEIDIDSAKKVKKRDSSHAATSGYSSPAATSGYFSHAATSGNFSHAATSGNFSPAATSGYSSPAATSGNSSPAATSGDSSPAATSGYFSHAATSGDSSPAATSGDSSPAATSGKHSIAAAIGRNSKAKSTLGNWIVVAEYGKWDGECYPVLCVRAGMIDGEILKPDVWYKLENGEFVEVDEE